MIKSLVLIEHDRTRPNPGSLAAISAARKLGGAYSLLVIGHNVDGVVDALKGYGAAAVLAVDDPQLVESLADRYAAVVAQVATKMGVENIISATSSFIKDLLPRVAAMLDSAMASDVVRFEEVGGEFYFVRPVCAGSYLCTIKLDGPIRVISIRSTAFPIVEPNCQITPIERLNLELSNISTGMEYVSRECSISTRPDLTEAATVVCGGRPLRDKETFERLVGGLADALGGAVGATRAAVDTGLAPNDCQVGQTGKTIAPKLYIGLGISGSVQHLAGIKDSKIIVAVNRDPDAPIFQIATYGLVADIYDVVPKLMQAIRK